MCIDVKHRHMVFTIPSEYREYFRKERDALNILFIASRNTLMKVFNKSLFDKVKRKKGIVKNPKDNLYLCHLPATGLQSLVNDSIFGW